MVNFDPVAPRWLGTCTLSTGKALSRVRSGSRPHVGSGTTERKTRTKTKKSEAEERIMQRNGARSERRGEGGGLDERSEEQEERAERGAEETLAFEERSGAGCMG